MDIQFGFPHAQPDYHAYEALQIFQDAEDVHCTLLPEQDALFLRDASGWYVAVPDEIAQDHRLLTRFLYDRISERTGYRSPWGCMTGIRPAKIVHQLLQSGHSEQEARTYLEEFYRIRPEKAALTTDTARTQLPFLEEQARNPGRIGVYVGIPFCPTRCLYCSFTSNPIEKYRKQIEPYLDLLEAEMRGVQRLIRERGLTVESVYLGGGTPTSLSEAHFTRYITAVRDAFVAGNGALREFSLEAGRPDSITPGKMRAAFRCGVTRVSVNPQTMHDATLRLIGRRHTTQQTVAAFQTAREAGFTNINMDLIAGLPGETPDDFAQTLDAVRALGPESVTVHTLSVKRAADLKRDEARRQMLARREVGAMVEQARETCRAMGLHPFYLYRQKNMLGNHENVSYCVPGCESPYNIHIMEEDQTILALGAGGVSKRVEGGRIERAFNVKSVEEYLRRSEEMLARKEQLMRAAW